AAAEALELDHAPAHVLAAPEPGDEAGRARRTAAGGTLARRALAGREVPGHDRRRVRRAADDHDLRIRLYARRQPAGRQEEARGQADVVAERHPLRARALARRRGARARAAAGEAELAARDVERARRVAARRAEDEARRAAVGLVDVAGHALEHRRDAALLRRLRHEVERDRPALVADVLVDQEVEPVERQRRTAVAG